MRKLYTLCLVALAIVPCHGLFRRSSKKTVSKNGAPFQCDRPSKSGIRPRSVHRLRPEDVEVIAAMGDSLTAGTGVHATSLFGLLKQYRGHTFTMGGVGNLSTLVTLPNILREYNPNLDGYSTGSSLSGLAPQANLNVAVVGAVAEGMPDQAERLVEKLRKRLGKDFTKKWKVISIFIGGNDICKYCEDKRRYSPNNFQKHLKKALDILKKNVPRAFVNLITVLDASAAADVLKIRKCRGRIKFMCKCVSEWATTNFGGYVKQLQQKTKDLANSYDPNDPNFTVVEQPFMKNTDIPRTSEGKVDLTYLSWDCFHFREKLQALAGAYLWKNMIEPVGHKTEKVTYGKPLSIACPSKGRPYLFTRKNS